MAARMPTSLYYIVPQAGGLAGAALGPLLTAPSELLGLPPLRRCRTHAGGETLEGGLASLRAPSTQGRGRGADIAQDPTGY